MASTRQAGIASHADPGMGPLPLWCTGLLSLMCLPTKPKSISRTHKLKCWCTVTLAAHARLEVKAAGAWPGGQSPFTQLSPAAFELSLEGVG